MTEAEGFIYEYEDEQRELMLFLHQLLTSELNLSAKIRFGIPFYYGRSWIRYLNPTQKGTVEFAFVRGNELSNEQGLLESKGRKQVLSVELASLSELPQDNIMDILQEALLLDETTPYESKRKAKPE